MADPDKPYDGDYVIKVLEILKKDMIERKNSESSIDGKFDRAVKLLLELADCEAGKVKELAAMKMAEIHRDARYGRAVKLLLEWADCEKGNEILDHSKAEMMQRDQLGVATEKTSEKRKLIDENETTEKKLKSDVLDAEVEAYVDTTEVNDSDFKGKEDEEVEGDPLPV